MSRLVLELNKVFVHTVLLEDVYIISYNPDRTHSIFVEAASPGIELPCIPRHSG